jgi:hypothetical protein
LVIKNSQAIISRKGVQEAYPAELDKFKWHFRVEYSAGIGHFKLITTPPADIKGDYLIQYE